MCPGDVPENPNTENVQTRKLDKREMREEGDTDSNNQNTKIADQSSGLPTCFTMDDEDFQRQLALEAAEARAKELKEQSGSSGVPSSNPHLYTDPTGTVYEWDHERKAWFPKIDDNFIARYQASYGFIDPNNTGNGTTTDNKTENSTGGEAAKKANHQDKSSNEETEHHAAEQVPQNNEEEEGEHQKKKRKKKDEPPPTWFELDEDRNTNVYIYNLPVDVTEEELVTFMSKCGLIMKDLNTNKFKIKLYKDSNGQLKGDALVTYIKVESVDLALQLLDESDFRIGHKVRVERAKFTLKGDYDPNLKPKRKKNDKKKLQKKIEKLFDWRPDKLPFERSKAEKAVIIKNMFDIQEFAKDPKLILEYRTDLREECDEKCGPVRKVEIYDNNPLGVAAVFFADFESADKCVELMNGRFFAGRQLTAESWDGKTRYKINESEEEAAKRMNEWDQFLEQGWTYYKCKMYLLMCVIRQFEWIDNESCFKEILIECGAVFTSNIPFLDSSIPLPTFWHRRRVRLLPEWFWRWQTPLWEL